MSRLLLLPGNNTLSHLAKCLAAREGLEARGHEVFIAATPSRAALLRRFDWDRRLVILPDIQEADGGVMPTFAWFRPDRVEACIRAERSLIERLRPDAVLGVFRFTGALSARLAGVPYDALVCGAMTPACEEIPGFAADEAGASEQAAAMAFFRAGCARRMAPALAALGLAPITDAWALLPGRRTFLWDFPEFQPLPAMPGYRHVGPLRWLHWPAPADARAALEALEGPLAYVAFGTGGVPAALLGRVLELLWGLGYAVALALGGQARPRMPAPPSGRRLAVFEYLAAEQALERADLVVCHGGQLLVFEAMRHGLPVFVLPMQPEQAQNGRCVERLGCGLNLLRGRVHDGIAVDPATAFLSQPLAAPRARMERFLGETDLPARLAAAAAAVVRHGGVEALATAWEQPA